MKIKELSVIIPVFNEHDNLVALVDEIFVVLKNSAITFEIIIIDDGSTDDSRKLLKQLMSRRAYLRVIFHRRNSGQSASIATGVAMARYNWIATLDGDRQNDPADIPILMQQYEQVTETAPTQKIIMVGTRKKRSDNWLRLISTRVANSIRRRLLKDNCPDTGCSLKIFPRDAFLQLPHFNHMHRFLPALFLRAGFITINVPVNHRPRVKGESKYGVRNRLWVGIIDLFGVMWLIRRSSHPEIEHD